MASLSLCMIVRDAAATLGEALASVRPHVDEAIVVDTGSVDASREIARRWDVRSFDWSWCDDFSAARNYSLQQATGDWIFWMDADDLLPAESGLELRRLTDQNSDRTSAYWVMVDESRGDGDAPARVMSHGQIKLFPQHPHARFRYRVHEQIAPALERLGFRFARSAVRVQHLGGARTAEQQVERLRRNLRLGLLDLQDHPDDPFVLFNLGATYLFLPDSWAPGVDALRRCVGKFASGSSIQLNAFLLLGQAYGQQGDAESELSTYRDALRHFPRDAILLLRLGRLHERRGSWDEAERCYRHALDQGTLRLSTVHPADSWTRAMLQLGGLYLQTGRAADAERLWRDALRQRPGDRAVQGALARLYSQPFSITAG